MTKGEVVKWLESLKKEIGKAENHTLWHYAKSIDMAIEAILAEAVHGKWLVKEKEDADGYYWWRECSNCGEKPLLDRWNHGDMLSNFCPHCGAKMKGADNEID